VTDDVAALVAAAANGSRVALARLLSAIEAGGDPQRAVARLTYRTTPAYAIGVTGAPGAGKSTLTDQLLGVALSRADVDDVSQVAVLCVDPSSPLSGGAILGDRIRMQGHATDERVFIRSMATRGHLGGLSMAVPDALMALSAAGFPLVVIETVGVGQMEVEIASAADTTVVVTNPGWGDSTQAAKAGLLEVADLFVINKADRPGVRETRRDLEQMLDLGAPRPWRPRIVETVATVGDGVDGLWQVVEEHRVYLNESGELARRRRTRATAELSRALALAAASRATDVTGAAGFEQLVDAVLGGTTDPYSAATSLLASS
jgi:LAO/AO transport system kinase